MAVPWSPHSGPSLCMPPAACSRQWPRPLLFPSAFAIPLLHCFPGEPAAKLALLPYSPSFQPNVSCLPALPAPPRPHPSPHPMHTGSSSLYTPHPAPPSLAPTPLQYGARCKNSSCRARAHAPLSCQIPVKAGPRCHTSAKEELQQLWAPLQRRALRSQLRLQLSGCEDPAGGACWQACWLLRHSCHPERLQRWRQRCLHLLHPTACELLARGAARGQGRWPPDAGLRCCRPAAPEAVLGICGLGSSRRACHPKPPW